MFIDLILLNHGSEKRNVSEIGIIQQGLFKRPPSVKVGMFRVINLWSINHEGVTGSRKRGRAVLVTLFLRVAQFSVVIQAILKEAFWNAVQSRETPLLF